MLLNMCIICKSILIDLSLSSIGSYHQQIRIISFLLLSFLFLSSLAAVAKNPSTILKKSDESEYNCLLPNVKGITFNGPPFSIMLAVGLPHMNLIIVTHSFSS